MDIKISDISMYNKYLVVIIKIIYASDILIIK